MKGSVLGIGGETDVGKDNAMRSMGDMVKWDVIDMKDECNVHDRLSATFFYSGYDFSFACPCDILRAICSNT